MFNTNQAIISPFGITVFGSATVRTAPNVATIRCAVSRLEQKPADAFGKAKHGAQAVQTRLRELGITDVGTSRVSLQQEHRYPDNEQKFVGYLAKIDFHVVVANLEQIESVVTAVVIAGANEIGRVSFETTRLKELRAEARRLAVAAAHEKAANYCAAAGVGVGAVLHIEDVNPDVLSGHEMSRGSAAIESPANDEDAGRAIDPGAIQVGAAVRMAYEIVRGG